MSNPQNATFAEFFMNPVEFKAESEKAGRPIYRDVPFVRLVNAGDRNNVLETKATDHYRAKYRREWEAFERGQHGILEGTPLSEWTQISKSQVKEAEFFNIRTVEQLAEVPDTAIQKIGMGWMELRMKARNYLAATKESAPITSLQAENERLREEIEAIKASLANPEIRKPGRPRKEEAEAT